MNKILYGANKKLMVSRLLPYLSGEVVEVVGLCDESMYGYAVRKG